MADQAVRILKISCSFGLELLLVLRCSHTPNTRCRMILSDEQGSGHCCDIRRIKIC